MISASVAKKPDFVEPFARYGKKTALTGCFILYIVIILIRLIIRYVRHVGLNQDPYVHHQIQHGSQSPHR